MKNTTILFDLDGTLIDSTSAILESFDKAFKDFGIVAPNSEDITSLIGYPLDIMFVKLGIKDEDAMKLVDAYKSYYSKIATKQTSLLLGAKDAIEEAYEYANLGIVTTKTSRYSKIILEHFGVLKYFDVVIGRDDVTNPKPNPEPILKALNSLGADAKNSWMVGDTILDLQSARDSRVKMVAVLCGYGKKIDLQKYTSNLSKNSLEAVRFIKERLL